MMTSSYLLLISTLFIRNYLLSTLQYTEDSNEFHSKETKKKILVEINDKKKKLIIYRRIASVGYVVTEIKQLIRQ